MSNDIAKKILKYYKNQKFKSIIIYGERGYGMSTYALKLISKIYSKD